MTFALSQASYQQHVTFLFGIFFSHDRTGQGTARVAALAEGLTLDDESDADNANKELEEEHEDILGFLHTAGLIYTHYGEERWSVFISCSLTATIKVNDPEEDGVTVTWTATGPEDEELRALRDFTGCNIREFDFKKMCCQLKIPLS